MSFIMMSTYYVYTSIMYNWNGMKVEYNILVYYYESMSIIL